MQWFKGAQHGLIRALVTISLIANVQVCLAQTAKYRDNYELQGFSQPSRTSSVASPTPGIVKSRVAHEGQRVTRGQCLMQLDSAVHDTKLELARVAKNSHGELEAAEAEHSAASTRLVRLRELAQRKHATQVELLQAEEAVKISRANVQRAHDRLAQQSADYDRLVAESKQYCIEAPFDGVVVEFAKQAGEYVGPGDATICSIANLDTLTVEFLVPRHYRHNLQLKQSVDVLFTVAGRQVAGTITYISPFPNGETNTYAVKVNVENPAGTLSAGERCQLSGMNEHSATLSTKRAGLPTTRSQ